MDNRKVVVVLFGGRSGEHEVSIRSASSVIREADKAKYRIVPILISKEGRWTNPAESLRALSIEAVGSLGDDAHLLPDSVFRLGPEAGLRSIVASDGAVPIPIDVIFPLIHGTYGEDGTIQGLFDLADVPYVGCGVLASANGMDKVFMKRLFSEAGLPICRYRWLTRGEWESDCEKVISRIEELGYPCFVKPANLGSSVGVSRANDRRELIAAIEFAATFDAKVIIEECLEMREIECAVLGNDDAKASLLGEYVVKDNSKRFLDYTEKYGATGNNEFVVPAAVDEEVSSEIRKMAIAAFKSIDGSGIARVDFFLLDDGRVYVNEINTMPGLTDASGYPKMWAASGIPISALIDALIELGVERHTERSRNKTSR
jgi:D-alanine-D-alanine ligase